MDKIYTRFQTKTAKKNHSLWRGTYSGTPPYRNPLNTDSRTLQTVSFVPTKSSHIFSKIIRLIQIPVNTDNGHFPVSRVTNSHTSSTPLYGHWLSAHCLLHCHNYVLVVDTVPCSNNDRFLLVSTILFLKTSNKIARHVWSVCLSSGLSYLILYSFN